MPINKHFDLAVIGGGPAGMMAAGRAAELGAKVVLIEKNSKLGKKLLNTGGGRCNITNAEFDTRKLVAKYGVKGKALFGAFARFGVSDTISFFEERGVPIKVEAEKRAFPTSNKAEDVWKVMQKYLKDGSVEILYSTPVLGLERVGQEIKAVKISGRRITARNYVVATGGKSRPETGSTGEGFDWMSEIGHTVEEPDTALVPVKVEEDWFKQLSGLSFKNAKLSVFHDNKKQESNTGKLLITHFGLSGPLVLNMSKNIAEYHKYGPVRLELDLYPEQDIPAFDKMVLSSLNQFLNKKIKNSLGEIIPPRMIGAVLTLAKIDPEKEVNVLSRDERLRIVKLIKALPVTVSGFLGVDKAIVTSGGVSLKEIDFKSMRSKLYPNLFLAGDILNFDRPTGGYSLQICWTTGYLAGENSVS
jgi:predicted Rossmann fold flavoprotein